MCSIGNVETEDNGIELEQDDNDKYGWHILSQILRLLGVHEGLLQFNGHALL